MNIDDLQSITIIRNGNGTWFSCVNFALPEDRLQADDFPDVKQAIGCVIGAIKQLEEDVDKSHQGFTEEDQIKQADAPAPSPAPQAGRRPAVKPQSPAPHKTGKPPLRRRPPSSKPRTAAL